jgi:hypothetical protein
MLTGLFYLKFFTVYVKAIYAVIVIGAMTELFNIISVQGGGENIIWMNIYMLFETIGVSVFFFKSDHFEKLGKRVISLSILALLLTMLGYMSFQESWSGMNPVLTTLESFFVIILSLSLFWNLLVQQRIERIAKSPIFWINSALIIYFSGSVFLFIFSEYLVENDPNAFLQIWGLHSIFNITFNVLLTVGFIHSKRATL